MYPALTPAHVAGKSRVRVARAAERPQPLVRAVANQRLETETNGIGICLGTAGRLGVSQQPLVDMKGFLHTYDYAIDVWLSWTVNVSLSAVPLVRVLDEAPDATAAAGQDLGDLLRPGGQRV